MITPDHIPFVVNLQAKHATHLEIVGGKGANLAILFQRGFNVPDAFIVTTNAFDYVFNDEQTKGVLSIIDEVNVDNIKELEDVSNTIKQAICNINLSSDMINLIIDHYYKLCEKIDNMNIHVAVRSSATAEDLPDNSFAGQQDTYLHVGRENLIDKIKECWASLFTARAISYRKKSNIDHKIVKLAVVVQAMISSEVSGVAFTANPITGLRNEVVIDSTYGLGEALVSGLVTPDHYEILFDNYENAEICVKNIGKKGIHIIGKSDGGTETLVTMDNNKKIEALSDQYIIQLAKLAKQVEKSYNYQPQDLEWSFSNEKLYILQARPITTLFLIPKHAYGQSGLRCMMSFGTVQGFLKPMTPLGQSSIRTILNSYYRAIHVDRSTSIEDDISSDPLRHPTFKSASNRLWIDITDTLTSPAVRFCDLSTVDTGMNPMDALALTRAVESNPTTEMNLMLWKLTVLIKDHETTLKLFENEPTDNLVRMYKNKSFDKDIQYTMDEFFHNYGCRGIGEIDIGCKRWFDEPQVVIEQIKNYLKIRNPDKAVDKIHDQSRQSAYEALSRIEDELRWPFFQRPLVNVLFTRIKILFSLRECPKYYGIIQPFGKCRNELIRKANLAVNENFISHADDIYFLFISELKSLAYDTDNQQYDKRDYWKNLILERRMEYKK
ncbi:unnamed protein product [Rotaria sp. Silwood2]|nr:unnamed protein product [Rotaria sp. Silwood2]